LKHKVNKISPEEKRTLQIGKRTNCLIKSANYLKIIQQFYLITGILGVILSGFNNLPIAHHTL